ncbi:type II toxin-antitoxin system HigB family toxin [Enterobacter hormaechei]|uniref:type II toxin-antitoxin system HigB family toxin n=1 Tax=Enterobacter hormaechei TaxID=158836 RepID=UPI002FC2181D
MHLISLKAILDAVSQFPQHREELLFLGRVIEKSHCPTPAALRKLFPTLDNFKYLDKHYVIDIANNNLRVVALIFFESQKFYVRHVFTHKEYDRFTEKHRTKGKK